jgi:hypothetical protein
MSLLLIPRDITALSDLEIDADKDWQGFEIDNLKQLAAGMQKGDILTHDGIRLVKLSPGNIGDELTSSGLGSAVAWQAPPILGD